MNNIEIFYILFSILSPQNPVWFLHLVHILIQTNYISTIQQLLFIELGSAILEKSLIVEHIQRGGESGPVTSSLWT